MPRGWWHADSEQRNGRGGSISDALDARPGLPGIAANGLRMRMGWYGMSGAVGMWLWVLPIAGCSGSVSVWASEEDLERFISLPHHVDIMRRYGDRGTVRSTTWTADRFDRSVILDRARTWIAST
jgi:hypothetical protein